MHLLLIARTYKGAGRHHTAPVLLHEVLMATVRTLVDQDRVPRRLEASPAFGPVIGLEVDDGSQGSSSVVFVG